MANPLISINKTIGLEGGYNKNLNDGAGETYKGLTKVYDSDFTGWSIIDAAKPLKEEQIIKNAQLDSLIYNYYKNKYWNLIKGDLINNQTIANLVFDTVVTSGKGVKNVIQKGINNAAKFNSKIHTVTEDNIFGNETLNALNSSNSVYPYIYKAREDYFKSLQSPYINSWLSRLAKFPKTIAGEKKNNSAFVALAAFLLISIKKEKV